MLAKALSITAISFDQLTSVVNPYRARMGAGKAKNVVWAIWMISVVCASPLIIWRTYHVRLIREQAWEFCLSFIKTQTGFRNVNGRISMRNGAMRT